MIKSFSKFEILLSSTVILLSIFIVFLIPKRLTPISKNTKFNDVIPTSKLLSATSWKTYTNTKYDFTIKYPPDWNVTGGPIALGSIPGDPSESDHPIFDSQGNWDNGELFSQISLEIGGNMTQNPNEFFEKQLIYGDKQDKITNKVNTIIDGQKAIMFKMYNSMEGSGNTPKFGFGILHRALLLNKNSTQYIFVYTEEQKDHKMKEPSDWQNDKIFDQILSTFHFNDSSETLVKESKVSE